MVVIAKREIHPKLYYTIENLIGELTQIIINFKNVPILLIDFYEELQCLIEDIERKGYIEVDIEYILESLEEMYQDTLDLFFEDLEKQANETNTKK